MQSDHVPNSHIFLFFSFSLFYRALLYPAEHAADITALEAEMATTLGANVRQVAYTHVLDKNYIETITPWLSKHSSRVEAFLYSMTSKTIAKVFFLTLA